MSALAIAPASPGSAYRLAHACDRSGEPQRQGWVADVDLGLGRSHGEADSA
jgi:hypothetical protein